MVIDVVRTYFDVASGFTELTRRRAVAAARTLLRDGQAGAEPEAGDAEQYRPRAGTGIQALAAELVETNAANRTRLTEFVDQEVRRQIGQLDVVSRTEHERALRRINELERRLVARTTPAVSTRPPASHSAAPAAEPSDPEHAASPVADRAPDTLSASGHVEAQSGAADSSENESGPTEPAPPEETAADSTVPTEASQSTGGATTKSRSTRSKSGKASAGKASSGKASANKASATSGSTTNRSRKNTGKRSNSNGDSTPKGGGAGSDDASS